MSQEKFRAAFELLEYLICPGATRCPSEGTFTAIRKATRHTADPEQFKEDAQQWADSWETARNRSAPQYLELRARVPLLRAAMNILEGELDPDWTPED